MTVVYDSEGITGLVHNGTALYWASGSKERGYRIVETDTRTLTSRTISRGEADVDLGTFQVNHTHAFWLSNGTFRFVDLNGGPAQDLLHTKIDAFGVSNDKFAFGNGQRLHIATIGEGSDGFFLGVWRPDYIMRVSKQYVFGSENAWTAKRAHPARLWRTGHKGGCIDLIAVLPDEYFNDFAVHDDVAYWVDAKRGGIFRTGKWDLPN